MLILKRAKQDRRGELCDPNFFGCSTDLYCHAAVRVLYLTKHSDMDVSALFYNTLDAVALKLPLKIAKPTEKNSGFHTSTYFYCLCFTVM